MIRSLDPESESESEYKITSSAAPNARATSPAPPPSTNIKIITRLAHEVYDLLPVGHPDCVETLKDRCAHLHIAYDATLVHKALDSAAVQRKRQA